MFRPNRGTLRPAGFVLLLTSVFVMVNSQVVYAASGSSSETGDLLAPLNISSSEGVPINGYELNASGGSIVDFKGQALAFALSGLFTLIRLLVGLAGWSIEVAFRFPLLKILARPAQKVADSYNNVVVDALGLKGLLLAWAFVFAGFMIVRGRVGRGLGEIFLTLLIGAIAASALIRPDTLLGQDGPLGQSQQVAAEVAQQSVNSYDWGGKLSSYDPCAGMAGNAELKCLQREGEGPVSAAEVARPIQDSITNALIVKPYMLLQYGRTLDPAKPSDRQAYAIHLKWVTGGYKPGGKAQKDAEKACSLLAKPMRKYCIREHTGQGSDKLPSLTPGGELLDTDSPLLSEGDQQFTAFLADLDKAGPVGKSCAAYAEKPTWWRLGGAFLLLIATLFICGMLLSSAIVLLGTQGICAAAAAVGGVTFVAGMLPGPARQSVWKWLSLWGVAILTVVGICAFIPFFGIAVDATITNGPQLMVERILLIDVLAIAGAAGHRRLLTAITSFGQRMAMRMRYAKVGGTHLPGDTSGLGAALAMNSPTARGGYSGGLRIFTGGGRFGMLGTRQRLMGALTSLFDGAGMSVDTGRMLGDATAEAGRGLAPLTAAAAVGGLGARLGLRGGHWLLIGRRPDREQLERWRKPTAGGDPGAGGAFDGEPGGSGGGGPRRPGGPPDRYRDENGQVVDRRSGQVLHDQNTDRTLLSTRAHNRLVRFRGYRIAHRSGRAAYGASVGLPATIQRARAGGSRYTQDARQQVQVWGNTVRADARAWADTGRHVSNVLREHTDDRGGPGPFVSRRLPTRTAAAPAAATEPTQRPTSADTAGRGRPAGGRRPTARASAAGGPPVSRSAAPGPSSDRFQRLLNDPAELRRETIQNVAQVDPDLARRMQGTSASPTGNRPGPSDASSSATRGEAQARWEALTRRTAADAERLRQQRNRPVYPWDEDEQ
ncbi:hypothetical protein ACIRU3_45175 [Streptomyces sp. NPDC101151]|uniref:hypothetical protein n=1 Tax=Streptomyces sp. NPDC101151 TaxID=3366115 RepID=UPI003806592A